MARTDEQRYLGLLIAGGTFIDFGRFVATVVVVVATEPIDWGSVEAFVGISLVCG
jgi:hypothetical protein